MDTKLAEQLLKDFNSDPHMLAGALQATQERLARAETRLQRAVEALRWYADDDNYKSAYLVGRDLYRPVMDDWGQRARSALEDINDKD